MDGLSMIIGWWQNLALILSQETDLPEIFSNVKSVFTGVFKLDFGDLEIGEFLSTLKNYTQLEFRAQFIILIVFIPFGLSMLTLLLFESFFFNVWYITVLIGIFFFGLGLLGMLVEEANYSLMIRVFGDIYLFGTIFQDWGQIILLSLGVLILTSAFSGFALLYGFRMFVKFLKWRKRKRTISPGSSSWRKKNKKKTPKKGKKKNRRKIYPVSSSTPTTQKPKQQQKGGKNKKGKKSPSPIDEGSQDLGEFNLGSFSPVGGGFDTAEMDAFLEKKKMNLSFSCSKCMLNTVTVLMLLISALFLTRIVKFEYFGWDNNPIDSSLADPNISLYSLIIGISSFAVSFFLCSQTCLTILPCGRRLEYWLLTTCKHWILRFILICLTGFYTPVVTALFASTMVSRKECAQGTRFPMNFNILSVDSFLDTSYIEGANITSDGVCQQCLFHDACNCSDTLIQSICPQVSGYRLNEDVSLSMSELYYFWPATGLMILFFVLGVPVFFFCLTYKSSRKLKNMNVEYLLSSNIPLWIRDRKKAKKIRKKYLKMSEEQLEKLGKKRKEWDDIREPEIPMELVLLRKEKKKKLTRKIRKKNDRERWMIRTALSSTPTRSLYNSFESRWRYFRLINTVVKIFLVGISIFLVSYPYISLPLTLTTHLFFGIAVVFTFPYLSAFADCVSILITLIIVIDAVFVLLANWIVMPSWSVYPFGIINITVLIMSFGLIIYSFLARYRFKKKIKRLHKRLAKLQKQKVINFQKQIDFKKINDNHDDVDELLLLDSMEMVNSFFKVMGIATFICMMCTVYGMLMGELSPPYVPSQYEVIKYVRTPKNGEGIQELEFAGYESWDEFTDNCCCQRTQHFQYSLYYYYEDVELWSCKNGKKKVHVRSLNIKDQHGNYVTVNSTDGVDNLRDFCSKTFNFYYDLRMPVYQNNTVDFSYIVGPDTSHDESIDYDERFDIKKYFW